MFRTEKRSFELFPLLFHFYCSPSAHFLSLADAITTWISAVSLRRKLPREMMSLLGVCDLRRRLKFGLTANCNFYLVTSALIFTYLRSQTKHLNGFSPEWIRRWAVRLASWEKDFKQMWHWYGFSPEWVRMCVRKVDGRAYTLSHRRHLLGLDPNWLELWPWAGKVSSWKTSPE